MSNINASNYAAKLQMAKISYDKNNDSSAYLEKCLTMAAQAISEHHGHDKISSYLSVGTPVVRGIIDYGRDGFVCPVNSGHSVKDFLSGLNKHFQARLRKDYYEPAEKYLPQKICDLLSYVIDHL